MPLDGDILSVLFLWLAGDGGIISNVFKMRIAALAVASWAEVADEIEDFFTSMYTPWLDQMTNDTSSLSFEVSKRDEGLGQWDQVYQRDFTDLVGADTGQATAPINTGTIVAYPGLVRFWGFKNMPQPSENAIVDSVLGGTAIADLIQCGLDYSRNWVGTNTDLNQGVYNEADEQFRPFAASVKVGQPVGSRVTRKTGRGI